MNFVLTSMETITCILFWLSKSGILKVMWPLQSRDRDQDMWQTDHINDGHLNFSHKNDSHINFDQQKI